MKLRSLSLIAVPVLLASAAWAQAAPANDSAASGVSGFASKLGHNEEIVGVGLLPPFSVSTPHVTEEQLNAVKQQVPAPFLLFTHKGHEYVITDPDTVNRAFEAVPHGPQTPEERQQWLAVGQKAAKARAKEISQNLRALVEQSKAAGKVRKIS